MLHSDCSLAIYALGLILYTLRLDKGASHIFGQTGYRWSEPYAYALLADECCAENNCWADFLDWMVCRAAA